MMISKPSEEGVRRNSESENTSSESPELELRFDEPVVSIPLVEIDTKEEEELIKLRARLFRYDTADHEWKNRGIGDMKLLRHKLNNTVRVVMRCDQTLKVCSNHFVTPDIRMNAHCGSDKAFNWSVFADYADETCKQELLAVRFANPQSATLWKTKFIEAQEIVRTKCSLYCEDLSSDDDSSIVGSEDTDFEPENTNEPEKNRDGDQAEAGVMLKFKELKVNQSQKQG